MQAFLPQLGADMSLKGRPGKVINITSVGGKYGAPFMGAYSASKHGVEGMSDSLRRELLPYGIDVIVIGRFTRTGILLQGKCSPGSEALSQGHTPYCQLTRDLSAIFILLLFSL